MMCGIASRSRKEDGQLAPPEVVVDNDLHRVALHERFMTDPSAVGLGESTYAPAVEGGPLPEETGRSTPTRRRSSARHG